jgi:hypothetical protein
VRVLYRAKQFWLTLTATPDPDAIGMARALLSSQQMSLFARMHPAERAHGLTLYQKLSSQGETHPDLLVAALLHDVGKSRSPVQLWERVIIVLAKAIYPQGVKRWGHNWQCSQPPTGGWRHPFVVSECHPAWGADMAHRAGVSPLAEALIRRHQETIIKAPESLEDILLLKLQTVDEES